MISIVNQRAELVPQLKRTQTGNALASFPSNLAMSLCEYLSSKTTGIIFNFSNVGFLSCTVLNIPVMIDLNVCIVFGTVAVTALNVLNFLLFRKADQCFHVSPLIETIYVDTVYASLEITHSMSELRR